MVVCESVILTSNEEVTGRAEWGNVTAVVDARSDMVESTIEIVRTCVIAELTAEIKRSEHLQNQDPTLPHFVNSCTTGVARGVRGVRTSPPSGFQAAHVPNSCYDISYFQLTTCK